MFQYPKCSIFINLSGKANCFPNHRFDSALPLFGRPLIASISIFFLFERQIIRNLLTNHFASELSYHWDVGDEMATCLLSACPTTFDETRLFNIMFVDLSGCTFELVQRDQKAKQLLFRSAVRTCVHNNTLFMLKTETNVDRKCLCFFFFFFFWRLD